jgi:hypothetical protein
MVEKMAALKVDLWVVLKAVERAVMMADEMVALWVG